MISTRHPAARTYDALDRQLTRTYSGDSTLNVSITYDSAGAGYHRAIGRIASLTDQAGSLSRSYDERGNITTDARTIGSQLYSNAYTYESAGRLSSVVVNRFQGVRAGLLDRFPEAVIDIGGLVAPWVRHGQLAVVAVVFDAGKVLRRVLGSREPV
jgi:YD repeat-containing protein